MLRTSKILVLVLAVGLIASLGGVSFGMAQDDNTTTLALINGTLIDGTGADPVPDAVIVIQAGRIAAVGARAEVDIPAGAQIIDVGGATMLPGFFNTHVHDGYSQEYLTSWVQAGVTTVRDMGINDLPAWPDDQLPPLPETSDAQRAAVIKGFAVRDLTRQDPQVARLVAAGPFLNVPGGYGGTVYPAESPDEVRAAVNDLVDLGADLIKTALDDGQVIGRNLPIYTPEQFAALVTAAHERDVPAAVHIMRSDELLMAIDAGVDEIDHMAVDTLPDEVIQQAVEHDVYWVPTLELWAGVSEAHGVGFGRMTVDNLSRFVAAGGKVALGTDFHGYFTPFEEGMPITEITLMHEAGMTPMQIIVAATLHAAEVCQLDADLGTLEAGKMADVLIVDGDPLADLQTLLNVRWVLRDGVIVREPASTQGDSTPSAGADTALELARNFSGGNADWESVTQEFDGVEMALVPAGCFMMGSTEEEIAALVEQRGSDWYSDEGPQHQVCFEEPFWVGRTEVTNAQYRQCVEAGGCTPPDPRYYDDPQYADHPVVSMTWRTSTAYAAWLSETTGADVRLLTEAQWEYAARGPDSLTYPWGNDDPSCELANISVNGEKCVGGTSPVGSYPDGASWVGALDMSGNVWEWIADWYGEYPAEQQVNPTGPEYDNRRMLRGGGWFSTEAQVAIRNADDPLYWNAVGFRVVVVGSLDPDTQRRGS